MKKWTVLLGLVLATALLAFAVPVTAAPPTIDLLNPPLNGLLQLEPGESYTLNVRITSDEPFILAIGLTDAYYPGRGVFWHGNDTAHHTTSALLHFTVTGKSSTDHLLGICDWPDPGVCWPDGVAPLSLAVGVRYKGGVLVGQRFNFAVLVP
jgi:hypothetical protein